MRSQLTYSLLLLTTALVATVANADPNWERLVQGLASYAAYPSSENAVAAREMVPDHHVGYDVLSQHHEVSAVLDETLPMLARQVEARDVEAVRLAFGLFAVTDGAKTEELHIMLGKLIRIDPELFLQGWY